MVMRPGHYGYNVVPLFVFYHMTHMTSKNFWAPWYLKVFTHHLVRLLASPLC